MRLYYARGSRSMAAPIVLEELGKSCESVPADPRDPALSAVASRRAPVQR